MRYRESAVWIYDMPAATRWTRRLMVIVATLGLIVAVGLLVFVVLGIIVQRL